MTHHLRHDCVHDCHRCDYAEPELCHEFAEMTHDYYLIRYCKHCERKATYRQTPWPDGYGHTVMVDEWYCPKCRRVFG